MLHAAQHEAVSLNGIDAAAAIKAELVERVSVLTRAGITPGLGTLLVGDDPGSISYVSGKHRDCAEVGIESVRMQLPGTATAADLRAAIRDLNAEPAVTGYIVQLPLPNGLDAQEALELIDPVKDADGLHPTNLGRLVLSVGGELTSPLPCTPAGCLELLERGGVRVTGKHVVVIGRGITVGRPIGLLLTRRGVDATVTLAHSRTPDLPDLARQADVVIAAAGVPHLVEPHWIKPGAAVLDVGVTRVGETPSGRARLAGDVHPDVVAVAGHLSPNPGGVGPMTRAMLMSNVVAAAERAYARRG